MDDLKLLGRNENDLKNEMKIVQTISKDINMKFGLEKCARIKYDLLIYWTDYKYLQKNSFNKAKNEICYL